MFILIITGAVVAVALVLVGLFFLVRWILRKAGKWPGTSSSQGNYQLA